MKSKVFYLIFGNILLIYSNNIFAEINCGFNLNKVVNGETSLIARSNYKEYKEKTIQLNGKKWKKCYFSRQFYSDVTFPSINGSDRQIQIKHIGISASCESLSNDIVATSATISMDSMPNSFEESYLFLAENKTGFSKYLNLPEYSDAYNVHIYCGNFQN